MAPFQFAQYSDKAERNCPCKHGICICNSHKGFALLPDAAKAGIRI